MNRVLLTVLLLAQCLTANAFDVDGKPMGTYNIGEEYFSVPQYLPYYPTAATIWPRVVEIQCDMKDGVMQCDGYNWSPDMGRAEYLFVTPVVRKPVLVNAPVTNTIIKETEKIIYKEVPVKKGKE